jgi:PilZ domain
MRQTRKYLRGTITATAAITELRAGTVVKSFDGTVIAIGYGGMGVRSLLPLAIGASVEAVLNFIGVDGKMHYETVQGKVVWYTKQQTNYVFGIQFLGLNNKDHNGLIKYLDMQREEHIRRLLNEDTGADLSAEITEPPLART